MESTTWRHRGHGIPRRLSSIAHPWQTQVCPVSPCPSTVSAGASSQTRHCVFPPVSPDFDCPHLRQNSFLANCDSPQFAHSQSPSRFFGFEDSDADTGFAVWQSRHLSFRANWCFPHCGQSQSPRFLIWIPADSVVGRRMWHFEHLVLDAYNTNPHP